MANLTRNDIYILSSLLSGDKYGLELLENVNQSGCNLVLGSLYNALARLEKDGLVESSWGETTSERGGNRRRYYRITADGVFILKSEQTSLVNLWALSLNHELK